MKSQDRSSEAAFSEPSDADSVKLLSQSQPSAMSTAQHTHAAASQLNFHPGPAGEDSVGASEGQAAEDPTKSQAKKRKRNKKKKGKAATEAGSQGDAGQAEKGPGQGAPGEDPLFTPLKDTIPDSFFED